ncbi:hypothetical protein EON67_04725 [archaeon]|nr:MAG: hypothetical protein EON67_04725 [archaeon]
MPAPAARSATSVVEARRSRRGSIDGCARTSTASAHVMSTPIAQTVGAKRRQPGMRALSSIHEQVYEPGMPLGDAQPPASKRCARSPMPHALDEDV